MRKQEIVKMLSAVAILCAVGCQEIRLKDGILYYRGKPTFIVGVWTGHSVTYKLPKFKEGLDPDLPIYTDGCTKEVARHVGFLSAHPAIPIRSTLERGAPEFIDRPKENHEGEFRAFIAGMGDLPLAMDFASIGVFAQRRQQGRKLAPKMFQQNPDWCQFVPLCPENPEAWKLYEDYFRTGTQKTLAAGANPYIYEIFNEPAYNCRCRWNRTMFRVRMEQRYGDIARANAMWGTEFKNFDEVENVPRFRDHAGLWVDWLKFMGDRYCDVLLKAKQAIKKADPREPIYFMEQPAVSMTYLRTTGIDPHKVAQVMDAVGMEGGVSFGAFKPFSSDNPMEGVIVNPGVLSHQIHLDMARSFDKPVINTEFYCARFHDGVRFPSRGTDLTTGLWIELMHGVSSDYFYNWGRRWWEWKDMAGAKRSAREAGYKAFCLLNPYDYPPESIYGIRDFDEEMKVLGDIVLPMPRIKGEIAVLASNPTMRMMMQKYSYTSNGADNPYETRMRDWYSELIFSHYPLDMIYEEDLGAERLKPYRALVVPKTPYVYGATLEALSNYISRGGVVIAEQGSFAMNEHGHKMDPGLTVDWVEEGLTGSKLHTALSKSLNGIGVWPAVEIIPADDSKEPLMVEAYVIDRGALKALFMVSWDVRSRLVNLRLPNVERIGKLLDLTRHPEKMAPRYEVVDPIAGTCYINQAQPGWSPEQLRKGLLAALPSQTRKILVLTQKPWARKVRASTEQDAREEYKRALAVDEKELAMVSAEFEAERKATESMTVDFGGPKNANGSCQMDPATVALCHFDGAFDAEPNLKADVMGKPQFAPGKFGTQAAVVREGERIAYELPASFHKDKGTIEAWVKPAWLPNDGKRHTVFVMKGAGEWNQNGMGLYKNLNFEFSFYVYDRERKSHVVQVPINIFKKDTWVHLAACWDNGSGLKLYVNGEPATETKATWQIDALPKIWIGGSMGGERTWDGAIDEFRVSNSVRTPASSGDKK